MLARVSFLAFSFLSLEVALAQNIGKKQVPILVATEVQILNDTDFEIIFDLRSHNSDWAKFRLNPGREAVYERADYIRIITAGKTVAYRLENTKRYKIAWNAEERVWDVYTISPK